MLFRVRVRMPSKYVHTSAMIMKVFLSILLLSLMVSVCVLIILVPTILCHLFMLIGVKMVSGRGLFLWLGVPRRS